ncbi:MAG: hypothetical protein KUG51_02695 [Urechidicola sp.]|nr:hypothetical protein [Urechidicola sp.]
MIKQNLRSNIFWFLDLLKGGALKTHFDEITYINQNDEVAATKEKRALSIRNLLKHATETTPYYKNIQVFEDIKDFPVISKKVIQDNFDDFRAENYLDKTMHKVATSGSTGVPFFLYQDENKN